MKRSENAKAKRMQELQTHRPLLHDEDPAGPNGRRRRQCGGGHRARAPSCATKKSPGPTAATLLFPAPDRIESFHAAVLNGTGTVLHGSPRAKISVRWSW